MQQFNGTYHFSFNKIMKLLHDSSNSGATLASVRPTPPSLPCL